MAQVLNLRPQPSSPLGSLNRWSTTQPTCSNGCFRPVGSPNWNSLQLKLRCKGRISAMFSNNGKQDQARKALESALGGKKTEFEKWNKEIQKREEMGGGGGGGGGWFGWRGWFGGFGGDNFWEEAQQSSLVVLVLLFVYLVIAKGEALLAVVFNPMLFALRGIRNVFSYITSNILRRISPAGNYSLPGKAQTEELVSRLSAKESAIRKWASD